VIQYVGLYTSEISNFRKSAASSLFRFFLRLSQGLPTCGTWTPRGAFANLKGHVYCTQGSYAVLKVLKKYWISKLVFKTLKKYWIWSKCTLGI